MMLSVTRIKSMLLVFDMKVVYQWRLNFFQKETHEDWSFDFVGFLLRWTNGNWVLSFLRRQTNEYWVCFFMLDDIKCMSEVTQLMHDNGLMRWLSQQDFCGELYVVEIGKCSKRLWDVLSMIPRQAFWTSYFWHKINLVWITSKVREGEGPCIVYPTPVCKHLERTFPERESGTLLP